MADDEHLFEIELRKALKCLYDPLLLSKSPLIKLLGLQEGPNAAKELRHALEEAIRALQPDAGCPPTARCQRNYQILFYRYVQQFTQRDVANRLGVSPRHLEREQNAAVQALAKEIQEHFHVRDRFGQMYEDPSPYGSEHMDREMVWLGDSLAAHEAEVCSVMKEAVHLAEPLACKHHVALDHSAIAVVPSVAVARTVLKQILLNLITTAIHCVPEGRVALSARTEDEQVAVEVVTMTGVQGTWYPPKQDGLDMVRRLVELFRGHLSVSSGAGPLAATVMLPTAEKIQVLAIEDNADTLRLWERYTQDAPFCLIAVRNPEQALPMAAELQPRLIVLDVMMPGIDGWDLLGQLRNHPNTSSIPVIVCTVLPQEELALSLGANGFLRKPATRQEFRAALERQLAAVIRG